ncbi:MAG: hypothetical protein FWG90_00855 [Oscillospiraceae bacterium]|nr:hypothetical protein [Oscillospiraceae bacterium]
MIFNEYLATLIQDKNISDLGRAADMLWLSIGEPHIIEIEYTGKKKSKEVSEFAIHFQCQWRFVKGGEILLASCDIYNPYAPELEYKDEWDWDIFGREKEQSSIFDVRRLELKENYLPLKIKNACISSTNDLRIDFENGVYFETFINCSRKYEYYRFIDFINGEHIVVFDEL